MPAKGQSGRDYKESEIAEPDKYKLMKDDTLWRVGAIVEQVFPVRHATKPYFKRFRASAYEKRIDEPRPRSEAHAKCIGFLLNAISTGGLKVTTPTFDKGVREADGQVLLNVAKGHYQWWSDIGGTRIPVGYGRYIQPDLCGRLAKSDAFAPSLKWPNLIVEVVDTHFPEEGTLFELLKLSTQNHIVALHFIRAPSFSSYWSRLDTPSGKRPTLRVVHLLVDGNLVTNGEPLSPEAAPPADRLQFGEWYATFKVAVLGNVMRVKDSPPAPSPKT